MLLRDPLMEMVFEDMEEDDKKEFNEIQDAITKRKCGLHPGAGWKRKSMRAWPRPSQHCNCCWGELLGLVAGGSSYGFLKFAIVAGVSCRGVWLRPSHNGKLIRSTGAGARNRCSNATEHTVNRRRRRRVAIAITTTSRPIL